MRKIGLAALALLAISFCTQAFAQDVRILFFEAAIAPEDKTLADGPLGFSKLVEGLREDGMLVASMSSGEITAEKLSSYEIVVLHASPERPFGEREISALVSYVTQGGGVLFVHGGTPKIVNPLTEIFGIKMDESVLLDASSTMEGSTDARRFVLTRFPLPSTSVDMGAANIERLGFYGGPPLVISKDAAAIVTGDEDCYSDNGLFGIGSMPPVVAASFLGRGAILVKSDRAIFTNENIGSYQNAEWADVVFKSLARIQQTGLEREESLLRLRARLAKLRQRRAEWTQERMKNETDLEIAYEGKKKLQRELVKSDSRSEDMDRELRRLTAENADTKARLAWYEGVRARKILGAAVAVILLIVFLIGLLIGRRSVRGRV